MASHTRVLRIAYSKEIVDGQPIFVSSNCLPIKAFNLEPAGHTFHSAALRLLGCEEDHGDQNDKKVRDNREQSYFPSSDSYSSKGKKKSGVKQQDHYALLGLSHLRCLATEEQIRKGYKDTALKYHPDKLSAILAAEETEAAKMAKKAEIDHQFNAVRQTYEFLMDPVKRRTYDSTDEFDDGIPVDCALQDFFKVFGPVFRRNGRWSTNQPVPSLGDDNTPMEEVDNFYNFWYNFKSWREFPDADEYDVEQAESRDHRRWMEKQNAKVTERARKDEYSRVRSLVDNAYKRDPRISKRKEEQKAEKKRKKEAKHLAKRLQEEEAAEIAEEEKRRKEEEKKRAAEDALHQKKVKEKEKKLLRKERNRLRALSGPIVTQRMLSLSEDDVGNLCMSFNLERLRSLCDMMEGKDTSEQAKVIKDACGSKEESANKDEKANPLQNGSKIANGSSRVSSSEKKKPWSKEEIDLLKKGMQKYPKGTSRRWEVISEYIGTERTVEETLMATKTVLLQKPDSTKAFDAFLEKRKPAQSIASPLSNREEIEGASSALGSENCSAVGTDVLVSSSGKGGNNQNLLESVPIANGVASGSSEQDVWSQVQEKALIQALKAFPKETNQRWERVATAVPGKTVNQCKKKFASLKENFRNKKSAV